MAFATETGTLAVMSEEGDEMVRSSAPFETWSHVAQVSLKRIGAEDA